MLTLVPPPRPCGMAKTKGRRRGVAVAWTESELAFLRTARDMSLSAGADAKRLQPLIPWRTHLGIELKFGQLGLSFPKKRKITEASLDPKMIEQLKLLHRRNLSHRRIGAALGLTKDQVRARLAAIGLVRHVCDDESDSDPGAVPVRVYQAGRPLGTANIVPAQRTCLCCRKPFRSEGPHNRRCDACRRRMTEHWGDIGTVGAIAETYRVCIGGALPGGGSVR